jgi:selenocysteine lyase/cysteine desulfurase
MMEQESMIKLSAARIEDAYAAFVQAYPGYLETAVLDEMRNTEYGRLDQQQHVYLDYTGGGLYAESQLLEHLELLRSNVFGNPHSHNPTSQAMTDLVEHTRAAVLEHFHTTAAEYIVVFTANASGALKLVGESYPFVPGGNFALCADDHNSVNGIREFARARGAAVHYVPLTTPNLQMDETQLDAILRLGEPGAQNLFAFPAQSNYSGVKHPLTYIEEAHAQGWDVLLDCAAFAPTNDLDLDRWKPDFAVLSFYKIFGYPTGIGALLVRRDVLHKLQRPWFAGGTVKIVSVQALGHYLAEGEAAFEEGTINYLNIPAVEIGLRHINAIGLDVINERVRCLTGWLLEQLALLRHSNGRPLVTVHGPTDLNLRGGTITMSFFDPAGIPISGQLVEQLAAHAHISLRTGCFCNPGSGEAAFQLPKQLMKQFFVNAEGMHFTELVEVINKAQGVDVSAVRVSSGLATNFEDVYRFITFAQGFADKPAASFTTTGLIGDQTMRDAS